MKRFRFKLETLLELRKRREEAVKLLLGKKHREIIAARKELAGLNDAFKSLQADEKKRRAGVRDALELRYAVVYRFKLKQDILKKARYIEELFVQAADIRKKLIKAKQERTAIEIVREKQYEEWRHEAVAAEQAFVDDVSQQGYIRRMRAEAASVNE